MKRSLLFAALLCPALWVTAQTKKDSTAKPSSTDSLMNSLSTPQKGEPVIATFKATRLIFSQTTETVKKKELNFLVIHRFGDIAGAQGGGKTFFGLDNSSDIYIGFEYGLTDNFNIGLGRSKYEQLIDMHLKYYLLHQTTDNSVPVAVSLFVKGGFKPYHVETNIYDNFANRFSYFTQAIIARKFSSALSLQVSPSYVIDNIPFPLAPTNENNFFAISAAGRLKFSKRMGIVLDYFHPFSNFRNSSVDPKFYDGIGVGLEIETGGHVFTINLSNAQAISEINYMSNTTSNWGKGQFRLGFTISRIFDFNKKNKSSY